MKWRSESLRRISVIGPQYGASAPAVAKTGNRPRYVRITDINGSGMLLPDGAVEADLTDPAEFLLEEGDLLFARSGNTVGKTYRHSKANGECVFAGYLIRFRLNPNLANSRYVFYFTHSAAYQQWVMSKKRVAGQPNINGVEYASLHIPLPPPTEQRRIVEILEQADALRRKRAAADSQADRILPALFYKLFGDPATNPKGLRKEPLGRLIKVKSGDALNAADMDPVGGYPVYGGNGINGYHSAYMFDDRRIVIGRVGAYCGVIHYTRPQCWVTDNALYVSEMSSELLPRYLVAALTTAKLNQYAGRAGQPLVSGGRIYPIEILVPPEPNQKLWTSAAETLERLEAERRSSAAKLDQLFATLLHRAFSGELTARWREAHLTELLAEMEQQAKALAATTEET